MSKTYDKILIDYKQLRNLNKDRFLAKAKKHHGDKYNYDDIKYINTRTPIKIYCNTHKKYFWQAPQNHIKNSGCRECTADLALLKTQDFISRAKKIHGDKYDYSISNYKHSMLPVDIICPIHGVFTNVATNHLKGAGCHKCSNQIHIHRQKQDDSVLLARFITSAKKLYGDLYDYSAVNIRDKYLDIYCTKHKKWFKQRKINHLRFAGCKDCAKEKQALTKEEFISRSIKATSGVYTYDNVNYINTYTKVKVTCPKHGDFETIPYDHMRGRGGCPQCSASSYEQYVYRYLDKYKIPYTREYKIGVFEYRYDIFIPINNIIIEIHGAQHYDVSLYNNMNIENIIKRDEEKKVIAIANGYRYYAIDCRNGYKHLNSCLAKILRSNIKYCKDGIYYSSFLEMAKELNLPPKTNPLDYDIYRSIFSPIK